MGNKYSLDALSNAGKVADRGGLTRAGRALDKHGNRTPTAFPRATGNPAVKNAQGQFQLDDILTNPSSNVSFKYNKQFGNVIDIQAPNAGGA